MHSMTTTSPTYSPQAPCPGPFPMNAGDKMLHVISDPASRATSAADNDCALAKWMMYSPHPRTRHEEEDHHCHGGLTRLGALIVSVLLG